MKHPLAVYTIVYLAILFVAVSIWGGDIAKASGDARIMLTILGVFGLKLSIDDYVHFQRVKRYVARSLYFSLAMYLTLATSIALVAEARLTAGLVALWMTFVFGTAWAVATQVDSGMPAMSTSASRRRAGYIGVNVTAMMLVGWAWWLRPRLEYSRAAIPLTLLLVLLVADFLVLGTLVRLSRVR